MLKGFLIEREDGAIGEIRGAYSDYGCAVLNEIDVCGNMEHRPSSSNGGVRGIGSMPAAAAWAHRSAATVRTRLLEIAASARGDLVRSTREVVR